MGDAEDVRTACNLVLDAEGIAGWKVFCLGSGRGGIVFTKAKTIVFGKQAEYEDILHEVAHTKHANHGPKWQEYFEELKQKWM